MLLYAKSPPPLSQEDTYNIWPGGVDPITIKSVRVHGGRKTYRKRRNNNKSRKVARKYKNKL